MYSKNIIFMDGEFNGLHADGTEFLSIAFIKPNGDELYLEIETDAEIDGWVKNNVIPHLMGNKISKEKAIKRIKEFIGNEKPYLIADVNQFDWMGICGLFGVWNVPFFYIRIDFASILWAKGIDPDVNREEFAKEQGIDVSNFKKHNALDDTKVLKALYEKLS